MHIVIVGNAVDGHSFIGPFLSAEEATEWATMEVRVSNWCIGEVDEPNPAWTNK